MNLFRSTLMVAVAGLTLTACSSSYDKDMGFLGSRDDIVINNKTDVAAVETKKEIPTVSIEKDGTEVNAVTKVVTTDKADATRTAAEAIEPAVKEEIASAERVQSLAPSAPSTSPAAQQQSNFKAPPPAPAGAADIPPTARPGECYGKVLIPAVTETTTERLQVAEEQKVLQRIIPAQYKIQKEQVLVREGRQYWKQGTGPIQKVNQLTGEILCLVEEPPVYKTVEKRVLVSPEKPEYKLVPAQFENVSKTKVIQPERLEWKRILCETNVTPKTIKRIQQALRSRGYDVGPIDGQFGSKTLASIGQYQVKNGLATRGITYETLNHLGVKLGA